MWMVYVEWDVADCGCTHCEVHPVRRSGGTCSMRGADERVAMFRGEAWAVGHGYKNVRAVWARHQGGA